MAAADNDDLNEGREAGIEDDEDNNGEAEAEADNEGEKRSRRVQLTASASVPLFAREERLEETGELGGSEVDLTRSRAELSQTGLHLAQSYAGKYPDPEPSISHTNTGHGLHKVNIQIKQGQEGTINISGSVCKH